MKNQKKNEKKIAFQIILEFYSNTETNPMFECIKRQYIYSNI